MARSIRAQLRSLLGRDGRVDLATPLILLGSDYARRAIELEPGDYEGWKLLGQLQILRTIPARRVDTPFDPIQDLTPLASVFCLEQAARRNPGDVWTLITLVNAYLQFGMDESAAGAADRLLKCSITPDQARQIAPTMSQIARVQLEMRRKPATRFENMSELSQIVAKLLEIGCVQSAADLLEQGYKRPEERTWETADRMATLRLRSGHPELARQIWEAATNVPRPAVRESRVAATYYVEQDFANARQHYRKALDAEPTLFDALYGLALLEDDAGQAREAFATALKAEKSSASDAGRLSAAAIADLAKPFASPTKSTTARP